MRARFVTPAQTCPGPHPSYKMDTGSLSRGVKRLGRGVNLQPISSTEVKETVELYPYSALYFHDRLEGEISFFLFFLLRSFNCIKYLAGFV